MTPTLYTSNTCKFCDDVVSYAALAGVTLSTTSLEVENPHKLRSAPAIEWDGKLYIGLDDCAAFIRRFAKENK